MESYSDKLRRYRQNKMAKMTPEEYKKHLEYYKTKSKQYYEQSKGTERYSKKLDQARIRYYMNLSDEALAKSMNRLKTRNPTMFQELSENEYIKRKLI